MNSLYRIILTGVASLFFAHTAIPLTGQIAYKQEPAKDTFHLQSEQLQLVIANNEAYGDVQSAGYSGVSELYLKPHIGQDLFTARAGGLNFEYIFSGDSSSFPWNIFEPRRSPMKIERLTESKVRLTQPRTENWPLASEITYTLNGNGIDFVYAGTPLADLWKKHGYVGVFFASYIDLPEFRGINFIGRSRNAGKGNRPRWMYNLPSEHGVAANHRPAGSTWDPPYDHGFPLTLVSGNSDYEYLYPFYYGVSGENVYILMFENPDKYGELRFAQSPNSGNSGKSPAWDFMYCRKQYKVGEQFSFRARAVYKKFEGREDVIRIYEAWSGQKVKRPRE